MNLQARQETREGERDVRSYSTRGVEATSPGDRAGAGDDPPGEGGAGEPRNNAGPAWGSEVGTGATGGARRQAPPRCPGTHAKLDRQQQKGTNDERNANLHQDRDTLGRGEGARDVRPLLY